jgi:outer membrane protein assembly factor BamB
MHFSRWFGGDRRLAGHGSAGAERGGSIGAVLAVAASLPIVWGTMAVAFARGPDHWPRFRGSDAAGQGGAGSPSPSWSDAEWAWTVELPGAGNASPVAWGERLFIASVQPDGSKVISCHAIENGKMLWSERFPGSADKVHAQNSLSTSTPVLDAEHVYWMRHADGVVHVEALGHDGKRLWSREIGPFAGEHGFGASPAVWRDVVIVPHDNDGASAIVGLDAATGVERWRLARDTAKAAYSTPLVLEGDPPSVVVASMAHGFTAIDPRDGAVRWQLGCFPKRTVSSPVVAAGLLLGTCGEGGGDNKLVAVRPPVAGTAGGEPAIAWQLDRSASPYVPTPLATAAGTVLWGDRGVVTCVDPADGAVIWKERVGGNFSASPIAVGNAVVNVSADGEIVAIAAAKTFEELGRRPLGEPSRATPAVVPGRIIFRGERSLRSLVLTPPAGGGSPTGTSR